MTGTKPQFEPVRLISYAVVALGFLAALYDKVAVEGEITIMRILTVILPLAAAELMRRKVASKAWLAQLIKDARTLIEAVEPIANETDVPSSQVPST